MSSGWIVSLHLKGVIVWTKLQIDTYRFLNFIANKLKCIIIKIRDKNCKGNKLNKSIDVREMYEYSKGLRSTCFFFTNNIL